METFSHLAVTSHHDTSSFECQCPEGFSGTECEDINECFQNIACGDPAFQGVCVDGHGTCDFSCLCLGGHSSSSGDGKKCDVDPVDCSTNPCQNGGTWPWIIQEVSYVNASLVLTVVVSVLMLMTVPPIPVKMVVCVMS